MSKTPNKSLIGLFTVVGLTLFVGMMLLFLGDKIFVRQKEMVVFYFEESIKGLSVGSPVIFKGVEIGRVMKIDILSNNDNLTFKIPVYVKFNSNQILQSHDFEVEGSNDFVKRLVNKGLRGRLQTQNFLTGQLVIELIFDPLSQAVYRGDGKNLEIPTVLSSFGELSKGMQDLPIRQSFERFNELMRQSTALVETLNKTLNNSKVNVNDTVDNLNKTIRAVGNAAQSLGNFADYVDRHPEALLKGKGKY